MKFFGSFLFYIKSMFGILRDKSAGKKTTFNDNLAKGEIPSKTQYPCYQSKLYLKECLPKIEQLKSCLKQEEEHPTQISSSDNAKEELVSVFVKTSQHLQEMVRGYETKVNQTTDYIGCLQNHISLLHDQLAHKNKLIGRMCDRYVSLCKEKQTSEEHLQSKVDTLSAVVEACLSNNASQLQRLLIQQVNRSRHLEYQNESLAQHVNKLSLARDNIT